MTTECDDMAARENQFEEKFIATDRRQATLW
jgi:hypothetical protein